MYDPKIGQFLSEDPVEFEGGDPNLRRYVSNQPTRYTDPTGLWAEESWPVNFPYPPIPPPPPHPYPLNTGTVTPPSGAKTDSRTYSFRIRDTAIDIHIWSAGTPNQAAIDQVAMAVQESIFRLQRAIKLLKLDCALNEYYKDERADRHPWAADMADPARRKIIIHRLESIITQRRNTISGRYIWTQGGLTFRLLTTQKSSTPGTTVEGELYTIFLGRLRTGTAINVRPLFFNSHSYEYQADRMLHELFRFYLGTSGDGYETMEDVEYWDRLMSRLLGDAAALEALQEKLGCPTK